jgi:hypothetical protein
MEIAEIASLVKIGFAGFAAAMAVLSYRLIRLQAAQKNPNLRVINALQSFTKYTLYLSLVVIVATTIDRGFDYVGRRLTSDDLNRARLALTSSQQAQDCRESLSGLVGSEGSNRPIEKANEVARLTYTACFSAMQSLEKLK